MTSSAPSRARRWWRETIGLVFLGGIAAIPTPGSWGVAIAAGICVTAGWVMGWSHRRTPLHEKLDRVSRDVGEVRDILLEPERGGAEGEPSSPADLRLVR